MLRVDTIMHSNSIIFKPEYLGYYRQSSSIAGHEVETTPYSSTFIAFARKDLICQDLRACYNAISNSKRALHRRVDTLCSVLGYKLYIENKNNFPSKLEFLEKCGIFTPQILTRLNQIRNRLEHDYESPDYKEAENYVDIIELFLMATGLFLKNYPKNLEFELITPNELDKLDVYNQLPDLISVDFSLKEGDIKISTLKEDQSVSLISTKINDQDYFTWLKPFINEYFWY